MKDVMILAGAGQIGMAIANINVAELLKNKEEMRWKSILENQYRNWDLA